MSHTNIHPGDALLLVDAQNDFLPGGALAVPEGDAVIAPLNHALAVFLRHRLPVFASRDWHPPGHCSFRQQGGPWPPHCVAGTPGAAFASKLNLPCEALILSKATAVEQDAYSAFAGTELAALARARGVTRFVVGGLATDYCVLNTVKDALAAGFQVSLLEDAIRAVNVRPGDGERAVAEMRRLGARLIHAEDLAP